MPKMIRWMGPMCILGVRSEAMSLHGSQLTLSLHRNNNDKKMSMLRHIIYQEVPPVDSQNQKPQTEVVQPFITKQLQDIKDPVPLEINGKRKHGSPREESCPGAVLKFCGVCL